MAIETPQASPATGELRLPRHLSAKLRYTAQEASEFLAVAHGVPVAFRTLDKKRSVGGGPRFQKFNSSVFYRREDLDAWALEKLGQPRSSTSDTGDAA